MIKNAFVDEIILHNFATLFDAIINIVVVVIVAIIFFFLLSRVQTISG